MIAALMLLNVVVTTPPTPTLLDPSKALIWTTIVSVVGGGIFAVILKLVRPRANRMTRKIAADEAAAKRITAEESALRSKEQGFQQAAEFIKASAETAIQTYKEQGLELRSTITVLTESIESQQRLAAAQRDMTAEERIAYSRTIERLRERIKALEKQLRGLLDHVRVQQLKIDLLEGNLVDADPDAETFPTLSRDELASLRDALHHHTPEELPA